MRLETLFEATKDLKGYIEMLNEIMWFTTLNTAKLNTYGKDEAANKELEAMMKQFRSPILNGKKIGDLMNEVGLVTVKNPKVIPHLLKWTYQFLQYVTPRIDNFCNDQGKQMFGKRIKQITDLYKKTVADLS